VRLLCWLFLLVSIGPLATAQRVETVFVPASKAFSHEPYLRFDPFTVNDSTIVNAHTKEMWLHDRRGYLWFKTDTGKLIRYDGNHSKVFESGNFQGIYQSVNGTIVATTDKGVALYDSVREQFREVRVAIGRNDALWPSTPCKGNKLYLSFRPAFPNRNTLFFEFDLVKQKFAPINCSVLRNGYTQEVEGRQEIYMARPFAIDSLGKVWGQINYKQESALGYYDPTTRQLTWYPLAGAHCPDFASAKRADQSLDIYWASPEPNGRYVWVGGWWHTGFLRLDTHNKQWKQYYFAEIGQNRVYTAIPLAKTKFMLTTEVGVCIFDPFAETIHQYRHLPENRFTPPHAEPQPITTGQSSVWVGIGNGNNTPFFSVLYPHRQYFRSIPQHPFYKAERFLFKKDNRLVFQFRNDKVLGVAEYDEPTKRYQTLYQEANARTTGFQFLNTLRDSVNKVVWFIGGTARGSLFRWHEARRVFEIVNEPIAGLPFRTNQIAEIQGIVRDKAGNLWLPTGNITNTVLAKAHLIKYDSRTKRFRAILEGTHGLPANSKIRSILCDSRGILWIGYNSNNQLVWFDPRTEQAVIKSEISRVGKDNTSDTMKMVEDTTQQLVWIAALAKGLWRYDIRRNTWKQFVFNDEVLNVHLMKDGTLWLKTFSSLVHFDPKTGHRKYMGKEYDLSQFQFGPFTKMADDELFFDKFRFYSHEIADDTTRPNAVFSFVRVFDKELPNAPNLNRTRQLTLQYDQNFFTIGFSILAYIQREKNQYAYKLDGFNTDWVSVGNRPLATFTNVPPGRYTLHIKGANLDGIWSDVKTLTIEVVPPFWQTWWFISLMVLLAIALLYALYRYRLAQQTLKSRLKAEEALRKQREAEYQQRIAQTEIAALRAQMNPHFIFNCLNSIQYFAANNDAEAASDYLTKFSRLIRLVLENSRSEKVTLANELETLRLYIDMEAMRFGKKLAYELTIAPDLDLDSLSIPPLLIQPFVENAIWHGLMHKRQGGTVRIVVEQPEKQLLRITITDDGIGRARAAEIKSKSVTRHKSFGMKVTAERIEQINKLYQTHTRVSIYDLTDPQGEPLGTQVVVEIPV
jgi:two-component sensor histidine kinase